jgi:phosphate transport system substrate-binding protein
MHKHFTRFAAGALAALAVVTAAWAADITGAGATFPAPLYAKWASAYRTATGTAVNYQSIGSGGGIKQIKARTVTFGASDMPLKVAELNAAGLMQFPTVIGGVVPVVNLAGIAPGKLVLDGPTLADIFLGKITKWNDPAIARLNPGVALPNQAIAVVHRSDGSGTTFVFTDYLSKVSPGWRAKVGAETAVPWPVGIGAKGNEGVAGIVRRTAGAIGYVEYAYAKQNKLTFTRMINRARKIVIPDDTSFAAAAAGATWDANAGFYAVLTDQAAPQAWPIAGATFILVYRKPTDPAATAQALRFFKWAYANGDQMATALDYVPLPDSVVVKIEASWRQVAGWTGR